MNKLLLNDSKSVNSFYHGQDLHLTYDFPKAWFVIINYNAVPAGQLFRTRAFWFWKRYHWCRKKGDFHSQINGHYPTIRITVFSPFPKKIIIPLKVNYLKTAVELPKLSLDSICFTLNLKSIRLFQPKRIYNPSIKHVSMKPNLKLPLIAHDVIDQSLISLIKISTN
jgi:hypothetical protein